MGTGSGLFMETVQNTTLMEPVSLIFHESKFIVYRLGNSFHLIQILLPNVFSHLMVKMHC